MKIRNESRTPRINADTKPVIVGHCGQDGLKPRVTIQLPFWGSARRDAKKEVVEVVGTLDEVKVLIRSLQSAVRSMENAIRSEV